MRRASTRRPVDGSSRSHSAVLERSRCWTMTSTGVRTVRSAAAPMRAGARRAARSGSRSPSCRRAPCGHTRRFRAEEQCARGLLGAVHPWPHPARIAGDGQVDRRPGVLVGQRAAAGHGAGPPRAERRRLRPQRRTPAPGRRSSSRRASAGPVRAVRPVPSAPGGVHGVRAVPRSAAAPHRPRTPPPLPRIPRPGTASATAAAAQAASAGRISRRSAGPSCRGCDDPRPTGAAAWTAERRAVVSRPPVTD